MEVRNGTAKTPLAVAIDRGSLNASICLLSHGASACAVDLYGRSLLHFLCERDVTFDPVMHEVVSRGVNVNVVDNGGNTPLHIAAYMGTVSKIEFLLSKGALSDVQNLAGKCPLFLAFHRNDSSAKDVILLLLLSSTRLRLRDRFDRLPLILHWDENANFLKHLEELSRGCHTLMRYCLITVRRAIGYRSLMEANCIDLLPCPKFVRRAVYGEQERKLIPLLNF